MKMEGKTKNILVLVEHAGQGGAEKVAATVAALLAERSDYRVHFCTLYQPEKFPQIPGVGCSSLDLPTGGGIASRVSRYWGAISRLRAFKKEKSIDLTISSLWPTDWPNRLTGREKKIAVIQINILNNPQNALMVKARRLVSAVYGGFDKIVLGGSNLLPELRDFFGISAEKLQVIHNPVDTRRAAQQAQESPMPALEALFSGNQVLMAAHRLSPIKNTEALLRIFPQVPDTGAKLLIVGEGEEKEMLLSAAAAAGLSYCNLSTTAAPDLSADVFFVDFQNNLASLLARATLFVFPTKGEGLPLVLLDAMTCGCPALVSDCPNGGISEIMESSVPYDPERPRTVPQKATGGYLMPIPENAEADAIWAVQIRELLQSDKQERDALIAAGKARAATFDVENIRQVWYRLTDSLLRA